MGLDHPNPKKGSSGRRPTSPYAPGKRSLTPQSSGSDNGKPTRRSIGRGAKASLKNAVVPADKAVESTGDAAEQLARSTAIVRGLQAHFPVAFTPQAQSLVPTDLKDLPPDVIVKLLAAKRVGVDARRLEIMAMKQQVAEKEKQIVLLKSLIETHENCLDVTAIQHREVEDFAHGKGLIKTFDNLNSFSLMGESSSIQASA